MRLCINPDCSTSEWENPDTAMHCENCGCGLSIDGSDTVTRLISNNSGFGTIYELEDVNGQQRVLKVLHARFNDEPKIVAMFQQEVYLLQQLAAPSLPKIDSYIHHELPDGRILHGIVMEKIAGCNLHEWLTARNDRPISQATAIEWLRKIVTALQLVHQQNYFHRDIKPSNIMLEPTGRLVLIDFGSARQESSTYLDKLYGNGGITQIASFGYTPPEQERGFAVPQSDFYALGMTFIHLVTGKHPLDLYDANLDVYEWRKFAPQITPACAEFLDCTISIPPIERPIDCASILRWLDEIADPSLVALEVPTQSPLQVKRLKQQISIGIGIATRECDRDGCGYLLSLFILTFAANLAC